MRMEIHALGNRYAYPRSPFAPHNPRLTVIFRSLSYNSFSGLGAGGLPCAFLWSPLSLRSPSPLHYSLPPRLSSHAPSCPAFLLQPFAPPQWLHTLLPALFSSVARAVVELRPSEREDSLVEETESSKLERDLSFDKTR